MALFNIGYLRTIVGYVGNALSEAFDPLSLSPIQYLANFLSPSSVLDISDNATNANVVDSPCVVVDTDSELVVASLTGSETVTSSGGTATPTVVAGKVTFTAGTCWELKLSNGSIYPMGMYSGSFEGDISSNDAHGSWSTGAGGTDALRAGLTDAYHYFAENGGTAILDMS